MYYERSWSSITKRLHAKRTSFGKTISVFEIQKDLEILTLEPEERVVSNSFRRGKYPAAQRASCLKGKVSFTKAF